ncbi:unnamed protein product [Zymoseptoria tritici ST99CH_1E4]|uniref:Piwi domain-containing protein n=2 Tax=Zymoseptoria tritici TaxID=1047171 RepID=F9WX62_ZYMTI|nr:uncharacterized protein MYCGRDRAFT_90232 [Zymoseptoria tritici IPO323]EGP91865.1 hypothetical protein MYCGRDRAFT_90232 [Zymoseptoria tritici IPO323]SMR43310.1 unnamed protein product [Zymoseptoria tritici ST99CH_1E4]
MPKAGTWCLRCPSHKEACVPGSKDFLKCNQNKDASELWSRFPNDKSCKPSEMFADDASCRELLQTVTDLRKQAHKDHRSARPHNTIVDQIADQLSSKYPPAVTKQHLEYAFQQVNGTPTTSSSAASAVAGTSSNLETATAQLGALNLSDTAQQPQQVNETSIGDSSTPSSLNLKDAAPPPQQVASNNSTTGTSTTAASNPAAPLSGLVGTASDDQHTTQRNGPTGIKRPDRPAAPASAPKVFTNHFTIDLKPDTKLYEYQLVGLQNTAADLSRSKKKVIIQRKIDSSPILRDNQNAFACNDHGRIIAWNDLSPGAQKEDIVDTTPVDDYSRDLPGQVSRQLNIDVVFKRVIDLNGLLSFAKHQNPTYEDTGAASALDILISSGTRTANANIGQAAVIKIGDNRFFTPQGQTPLPQSHGLVAMRGYSSSVQPVDGALRLNINTALSAFYQQQKVLNVIETYRTDPGAFPRGQGAQHLTGVRVKIMYNRCKPDGDPAIDSPKRRIKTITGFSAGLASQTLFDRNGQMVSVWQHFKETYPIPAGASVVKGNQICVNTGSTTEGKECWFLPDQLEILPGQIFRKTLDRVNSELPGEMITLACQTPAANKGMITSAGLQALGLTASSTNADIVLPQLQALRDAGMTVAAKMLKVPFRRVNNPAIVYAGGNKTANPDKSAGWSTRGQEFLTHAKRIPEKGMVSFLHLKGRKPAHERAYIDAFMNTFQLNLRQANNVNQELDPVHIGQDIGDVNPLCGELSDINKRRKANLSVLILPDDNKLYRQQYASFRIVTDQLLGCTSIVLNEKTMCGGRPQPGNLTAYMANNAMKINVRFGNENHTVRDGFKKLLKGNLSDTLVLGADLIHPGQRCAAGTPTIAAVVGSVNATFGKLLGSARRQQGGQEIIEPANMKSMVTERMKAWIKSDTTTKGLPTRIIYFRDGTGLSQYSGILQEISAIKTAWSNLNAAQTMRAPKPVEVTCIVAVKRHNTRFYPLSDKDENMTATWNCKPGMVVDTHITSPLYMDFFLQSHDVEKGSAKPTHYFVLENGMKLKEAELQDLTNSFCYTFQHSTSAVSYPAPVYAADKLCERLMLYLYHFNENSTMVANATPAVVASQMNIAWQRGGAGRENPWHPNLDDKMFWM